MEKATQSEIEKRLTEQNIKGELFSSFLVAAIPIFNAFFYWHTGKKVAIIAKDANKARRTYSLFGWILMILPFAIAQLFMTLGQNPQIYVRFYSVATPLFWVLYLIPAFLIARKHTLIVKQLGVLSVKS